MNKAKLFNMFPDILYSTVGKLKTPRSIAVLMYHEVLPDDFEVDAWTIVKESDFRRQLQYIVQEFEVISLDRALQLQQEGQLGQQLRAAAPAVPALALPLLQRDQQRVEHHRGVERELGAPVRKEGAQLAAQPVAARVLERGRALELHLQRGEEAFELVELERAALVTVESLEAQAHLPRHN